MTRGVSHFEPLSVLTWQPACLTLSSPHSPLSCPPAKLQLMASVLNPSSLPQQEKTPTLLDLQRQRSRDDVRRHRARKRLLRSERVAELQALEQQYQAFTRVRAAGAMSPSQRQRLIELFAASRQLRAEHEELKRALDDRERCHTALHNMVTRLLEEQREAAGLAVTSSPLMWTQSAASYSEALLFHRWRTLRDEFQLFRLGSTELDESAVTFGWSVVYHCKHASDFFISLTKSFPVNASVVHARFWSMCVNGSSAESSALSSPYRVVDLQNKIVGEGTIVMNTTKVQHPTKRNTSLLVSSATINTTTPDGYTIGCVSLAEPSNQELDPHEELANVSSWVSVTRCVDPATGVDSSAVELAVHWQFDTGEATHIRILNALQVAMAWEHATLSDLAPTALGVLSS